jgi:hypothetical protein
MDRRRVRLTSDKLSRCSLLVTVGLVGEERLECRENELAGSILEDLEDGLDACWGYTTSMIAHLESERKSRPTGDGIGREVVDRLLLREVLRERLPPGLLDDLTPDDLDRLGRRNVPGDGGGRLGRDGVELDRISPDEPSRVLLVHQETVGGTGQ